MTKTRITAALSAAVLGLLLAGCSSISAGTITDKDHRESYYYPQSYCSSYNSKGACTMHMTRMQYVAPKWSFSLKEGKETGWTYVTEDTYNRYEVGDYYNAE